MSWVKRVEAVLGVLKGSSIEEIELTEGELQIIVRRSSGHVVAVVGQQQTGGAQGTVAALPPAATSATLDMKSPLTGVYYAAASPSNPPLIKVGDTVSVGQTVALIEAMKVFSEIPSEVAGRIVAINVHDGDVVKKGDVLFQVEPL